MGWVRGGFGERGYRPSVHPQFEGILSFFLAENSISLIVELQEVPCIFNRKSFTNQELTRE